jgi:hypothetical protein
MPRLFSLHGSFCLIAALMAIGWTPNNGLAQEESDVALPVAEDAAVAPAIESGTAKSAEPSTNGPKSDQDSDEKSDEKGDAKDESQGAEKDKGADMKQAVDSKDAAASEMTEDDANDSKDDAKGDAAEEEPKKKEDEKPKPRRLPRLGSRSGPMLPGQPWRVHDVRRPRPAMVTPGELSTYEKPGTPPSDAIVLFDGTDLSQWCHISSDDPDQMLEAQWKVKDGYFEVAPNTGSLQTIDNFGSCQLHIEWQAPAEVRGDSQGRGNSGIYFMGEFEVQVLDSFNNRTYADGQAGALYGQYPPMVNASRKPGEWQIYDILFQAPKFSLDGELERPALVTVIHNGIFLHNAREYVGKSGGGVLPKYDVITPAAPIRLQDHGNPVRFRNVWLRPLPE